MSDGGTNPHTPLSQVTRPAAHLGPEGHGGRTPLHAFNAAASDALSNEATAACRMAALGQPPPQQPMGPSYTGAQSVTATQFRA